MNRTEIGRRYCILIAACVVLFGCGQSGKSSKNETGAFTRGTITFLEGEVSIDGNKAKIGDTVSSRAFVATGSKSGCEIVFDGKNIISFDPDTKARLDVSGSVKGLDLEAGTIKAVLQKLAKIAGTDSFRLTSGNAALGVRGTVFAAHAENNVTYICCCNGTVDVSDANGNHKETMQNAHHGSRVFTTANGKIGVAPDGMEYHTDADMESLASKIGYTIDWTKVGTE
jgi:ferric-dicitrate binding protein FerR (iron transport regulator)